MSKHQKTSDKAAVSSVPKLHRSESIVFERLLANSTDDFSDVSTVFRAIKAYQTTPDDRALEFLLKKQVSGRMVTLDNMKNSEFYKRKDRLSRTLGSAELKSVTKMAVGSLKYSDFVELTELWTVYAKSFFHTLESIQDEEVPESVSKASYLDQLMTQKLELVGAIIKVCGSSNSEIVGFSGVVIEERENVIRIVDELNKTRTIPKSCSSFSFCIGDRELRLHGPALAGIGRTGSLFRACAKVLTARKRRTLSFR
jgi:RNase P/RNase MRP subunit p29